MDLRKLKTLIDLVSESNVSELEITEAEGKVRIVKSSGVAPAMVAAPMMTAVASAPLVAPTPAAPMAASPTAAEAAAPEVVLLEVSGGLVKPEAVEPIVSLVGPVEGVDGGGVARSGGAGIGVDGEAEVAVGSDGHVGDEFGIKSRVVQGVVFEQFGAPVIDEARDRKRRLRAENFPA